MVILTHLLRAILFLPGISSQTHCVAHFGARQAGRVIMTTDGSENCSNLWSGFWTPRFVATGRAGCVVGTARRHVAL